MKKFAVPMLMAALLAFQACSMGGAGKAGRKSGSERIRCPPQDMKVPCHRVDGKYYVST